MTKDIIIDLALLSQKKQDRMLDLLNEMGFRVIKVKTSLNKQRTEISVSPDFCFCLCCGTEMESKDFKAKKSDYMCRYCSSGACELEDVGYEEGHGQSEKVTGTRWEEEKDEEEDVDEPVNDEEKEEKEDEDEEE
jgi:hypothetical protein